MPRIYPPHDPERARGTAIPPDGELFSKEDADRLVGAGLAARRPAGASRSRDRGSAERKAAVKPRGEA